MKRIKIVIFGALIVVISGVMILSDILVFGAKSDFFNAGYWVKALMTNGASIALMFLSASINKDRLMTTHTTFKLLETALSDTYDEIRERGLLTVFKQFIAKDNHAVKLSVYKDQLDRKISKLNDKIEKKEARYNVKRVKNGLAVEVEPKTPKLIHLRIRKKHLETKLKNAETAIPYVKVRYSKVTYSSIFGKSERGKNDERDMKFHTVSHNIWVLAKKAFFIALIGFLATLTFEDVSVEWSVYHAFKICMRVFTILTSLYAGLSDAEKFVSIDMCDALQRRLNYVQFFVESKAITLETDLQLTAKKQEQEPVAEKQPSSG